MGGYWTTMQVPREIIKSISEYCETDHAVNSQLTNKTRTVSSACNTFLSIYYDKNTKFAIFKEINYNECSPEQKEEIDKHNSKIIKLQKEIQEKIRFLCFYQEFIPNFQKPKNEKNPNILSLTCYHPVEDKLKHSDEKYELRDDEDGKKLWIKYIDPDTKEEEFISFIIKNNTLFCPQHHNDCKSVHTVFNDVDIRDYLNSEKIALIFPPPVKSYK